MKKIINIVLSKDLITIYNKKYSVSETVESIFEVIEECNCTYRINYCGHKVVVNKRDAKVIIN